MAGLWFTVHVAPRTGTVDGAWLASVPVGGTSPRRRGKQEEGMGLYPGWHEMAEGLGRLGNGGPR
jgi:hypothetical protein